MRKAGIIIRHLLKFSLLLGSTIVLGKTKIAIIQPIQHQALDEIAAGFKATLNDADKYQVEVLNAQGDMNAMHSMLLQQVIRGTDIIAPIGLNASRMAERLLKDKGNPSQKLIALAVNSEFQFTMLKDRGRRVLDEMPVSKSLDILKSTVVGLKKIAVIYSPDERLVTDLSRIENWAKTNTISLQKIMVHNHQEVFSSSKSLQADAGAIFVLKDHLVVSAIAVIKKVASEHKIPLFASDEGSVIAGADLAFGVNEAEIGVVGAKLAQVMEMDLATASDASLLDSAAILVNPSFSKNFPAYWDKLKETSYKVHVVKEKP